MFANKQYSLFMLFWKFLNNFSKYLQSIFIVCYRYFSTIFLCFFFVFDQNKLWMTNCISMWHSGHLMWFLALFNFILLYFSLDSHHILRQSFNPKLTPDSKSKDEKSSYLNTCSEDSCSEPKNILIIQWWSRLSSKK